MKNNKSLSSSIQDAHVLPLCVFGDVERESLFGLKHHAQFLNSLR